MKVQIQTVRRFLTLAEELGITCLSVAEVCEYFDEDIIDIPEGCELVAGGLIEYLEEVMTNQEYETCREVNLEDFLKARIRAFKKGYHRPRTIPASALVVAGEYDEDTSGGGYSGGRRTTRNANT